MIQKEEPEKSTNFFYVYSTVHDKHIINTKFPTQVHNVVLFRRVSA
jgi:hypothetical protein